MAINLDNFTHDSHMLKLCSDCGIVCPRTSIPCRVGSHEICSCLVDTIIAYTDHVHREMRDRTQESFLLLYVILRFSAFVLSMTRFGAFRSSKIRLDGQIWNERRCADISVRQSANTKEFISQDFLNLRVIVLKISWISTIKINLQLWVFQYFKERLPEFCYIV